jgi:hypothetical protein
MKNLVLIIVALATGLQAFAQQYVPMPTGKAQWNYTRTKTLTMGPTTYTRFILMQTGNDTVINAMTYKKIMIRQWTGNSTPPQGNIIATQPDAFWGGIREDNKKVYAYLTGSSQEHLIYDFTLNAGDFAPNFSFLTGNATPLKVVAIDSVQIGGLFRKRFQVATPPSTTPEFSAIEGIGSDRGLVVWRTNPSINDNYTFHCYTDSATGYATNIPCSYIWDQSTPVSTETLIEKAPVAVYPNPFSDYLTIKSANAASATLSNITGRIVFENELSKNTTISAGHLPAGLYLLKLFDKDGHLIQTEKLSKF